MAGADFSTPWKNSGGKQAVRPAETLGDPYYKRVPLPRIQGYRKLDQEARIAQVANMVYTPHWQGILRRNSVLLSRILARDNNYASNTTRRRMNMPYRDQ